TAPFSSPGDQELLNLRLRSRHYLLHPHACLSRLRLRLRLRNGYRGGCNRWGKRSRHCESENHLGLSTTANLDSRGRTVAPECPLDRNQTGFQISYDE